MTPSRVQKPVVGALSPTGHRVTGGPPETSIFLSLPWLVKPRNRPSGDQKGKLAPSVPGRARVSRESSVRIQNMLRPPAGVALNTSLRPSGDKARLLKLVKLAPSGSGTANRTTSCGGAASRKWRAERAI